MERNALIEIIGDQREKRETPTVIERECLSPDTLKKPDKFIHIFSGVRRSGKSTLLQWVREKQSSRDYYLNFDDERLINFDVSDFQKLLEIFMEQFGEQKVFYFDEIQNVPGWERFIRRLYDEGNKIYITGSNAQLLSKELGTHLTGRTVGTEVYPFSFREYLILNKLPLKTTDLLSTKQKVQFKKHLSNYVENGGFPEFLLTQNAEYLKQLYENILYRDIVVRHRLPQEKVIKELGLYCASNIGKQISFNQLKNMFRAGSATTMKEYLSYFENSYLFFLVNRFDYSLKKQIYAPKKVYCIDTRLAREIGFRFSQDQGRYLENVVFLELKRRGEAIFYHADRKECDFLIQKGVKITEAIQVSTSIENESVRKREYSGLIEAMEMHGLNSGLILTENESGQEVVRVNGKKKKILILPVWQWLLKQMT